MLSEASTVGAVKSSSARPGWVAAAMLPRTAPGSRAAHLPSPLPLRRWRREDTPPDTYRLSVIFPILRRPPLFTPDSGTPRRPSSFPAAPDAPPAPPAPSPRWSRPLPWHRQLPADWNTRTVTFNALSPAPLRSSPARTRVPASPPPRSRRGASHGPDSRRAAPGARSPSVLSRTDPELLRA